MSPPWVEETFDAMDQDFSLGLPAETVADAYSKSLEGIMSGTTIDARTVA